MGWLRRGVLLLLTPVHRWTGTALARLAQGGGGQDEAVAGEGSDATDLHQVQAEAEGLGPPAPPEHWLKLVGRAPAGAAARPRAGRAPAAGATEGPGPIAAVTSVPVRAALTADTPSVERRGRSGPTGAADVAPVPRIGDQPRVPIPASASGAPTVRPPLDAVIRLPQPLRSVSEPGAVADARHGPLPLTHPHAPAAALARPEAASARVAATIPDAVPVRGPDAAPSFTPVVTARGPAEAAQVGQARPLQQREVAAQPSWTPAPTRPTSLGVDAALPSSLVPRHQEARQSPSHPAEAVSAPGARSAPALPDMIAPAPRSAEPRHLAPDHRPAHTSPLPPAPTADRWPALPGVTAAIAPADDRWPALPLAGQPQPATDRLPRGGAPWNA